MTIKKMRERLPYDAATVASLGVGLKLFSEVMVVHRDEPVFAEIRPALGAFMKQLKSGPQREPIGASTTG